jgi:glycosyltransferase involved in cell wall biosynthesis
MESHFKADIVIPVLNEAHVLERTIATLRAFLTENLPYCWRIVIVDNGSTDGTSGVGRKLAAATDDVQFLQLDQRGRGRALRYAWMQSQADVVCYMDVDLSTHLSGLPRLIDAILIEGYDIATGSRLLWASRVKRSLRRELISRTYNVFLQSVLGNRFSDAQCGFKAVNRKTIAEIVPHVEDQSWFFDTELMVLAERRGFRIKDIPIVWIEDDDSRVRIVRTAWDDIKGVYRLRRQFWAGTFGHAWVLGLKRRQP